MYKYFRTSVPEIYVFKFCSLNPFHSLVGFHLQTTLPSIMFAMSESTVLVVLPTHTKPAYNQHIIGRLSPKSSDLEEFRGVPFGFIPGRWQHSKVTEKLPADEYNAWNDG
jgi:hypothetical protein